MTPTNLEPPPDTTVQALRRRILEAVNLTGYPVTYLRITLADAVSFPSIEVHLDGISTDYIPRKTDHV
jgi:hypothetical protein